jgi:hypothetical protein
MRHAHYYPIRFFFGIVILVALCLSGVVGGLILAISG